MLAVNELLNCDLLSLAIVHFGVTGILTCLLSQKNTVAFGALSRVFQETNAGSHYSNIEHSIRVKIRCSCPTKCGPISEIRVP
jgi:hypothetical protein